MGSRRDVIVKAKEYAQRITDTIDRSSKSDEIRDEVIKVVQDLLTEANQLVKSRHCQTDAACAAVLDEIDDRWQVICRLVDAHCKDHVLKRTGFRDLLLNAADDMGHYQLAAAWKPKRIA